MSANPSTNQLEKTNRHRHPPLCIPDGGVSKISRYRTTFWSELTAVSCASTGQANTFQVMGFHYRFSRGDRVQIISGKHEGATGTVDANVFQRSVDFPTDHLPCHHVLLDNRLVITINVNQVEALDEFGRRQGSL